MTTSADIRTALRKKWTPGDYFVMDEAPTSVDRQGRKIDLLAISCWASRGLAIDAVEIKVSMGDWRTELKNPEKADWWFEHSDRFWLAVPKEMGPKVKDELPVGWGLLVINPETLVAREVVKATKHEAKPLPKTAWVGMLRAASGAGFQALQMAESRGREAGRQMGRDEVARRSGDSHLQSQLDKLNENAEAFKKVTGIDIRGAYGPDEAARIGEMVKIFGAYQHDPERLRQRLEQLQQSLVRQANSMRQAIDSLGDSGIEPPA